MVHTKTTYEKMVRTKTTWENGTYKTKYEKMVRIKTTCEKMVHTKITWETGTFQNYMKQKPPIIWEYNKSCDSSIFIMSLLNQNMFLYE